LIGGLALLAPLLLAGASADHECRPDRDLAYVCGPERPEDVLVVPDSPWLVASGFAPGAGIKLVDTRSRSWRKWYDGTRAQVRFDHRRYRQCPGPVDPTLFNARGMGLRQTEPGRWELLVVNHGGRESIEVFEIERTAEEPRLTWRGCLPMPAGQVGNSVASFADRTVLVTVLTRPGTTIADFVEGRPTGAVWQWTPGATAFTRIDGTELPGNNGLEVDPDGHRFYVVAFGWHAVVIFDRRRPGGPIDRIDAADFMPDNIHWTGGRLLLAGMRYDEPACGGLRPVVDGKADPMLCHRGWIVGELDIARRRIATIAYGSPQASFNGLSAAAIVGDELWLGSFQSNRIATVRIHERQQLPRRSCQADFPDRPT